MTVKTCHQKCNQQSCLCCLLQLDLTFHLFVCALAGAGAAVIAMVRTNVVVSDFFKPSCSAIRELMRVRVTSDIICTQGEKT